MGLVNDKYPSFVCSDALDDNGYVLTLDTTNNGVKKAASTDTVFGVAITATKDMYGNAVSNKEVAVIPAGRAVVAELKVASANQAISFGAPLCVDSTEAGTVDYRDGTNETGTVIAYALETKSANAGGKVKALLL